MPMYFSCISHVFAHVYLMYFSCILKTCISHVFQNMYFSCISHVFLMYFMMSKMRNQCISHVFSKSMLFVKWEINVFLMYFLDLDVLDFSYFQNTWEIHEKYMFWLKSSFLLLIFYLWGSKNTWEIHEKYMRNTLISQSVFCNFF